MAHNDMNSTGGLATAPRNFAQVIGAPAPTRTGGDLVVATHDLTKTFGSRTVVDSLDLAVPAGCVYGFLGPNGSGKSTTMKMILGLLRPTRGRVNLFGRPVDERVRAEVMPAIGSMIEYPPGYGHLTGAENMRIVQQMLGLEDSQVARALELVKLTPHKDRLQRTYSMGMKQRLGIAMALARNPQLLVLDEPTNGLDPAGIEEIRELLIHLADEGVSVMVSSHLLDEIDKMASVLGILSGGKLLFQGTRRELFTHSVPDVLVVTSHVREALALGLRGVPTPDGILVPGLNEHDVADMVARLVQHGIPLHEVRRVAQSLEDVFMDITGREGTL
ncbi:ABC transporter ATP-binding protein [Schaalia sp. 19OD2882]|uniref:ABC transporter ATP-binding protein n=1 Tax=Schaalia sp. 19OD2882 TaxID=2794089 RepID=UPI001C1F1EDD|nr:ABC transporter ATP-binding protein [Schaalia sp. 19OD2882]QWW20050.1 ABC transporter ATP-binding protein [Schaalia sp. 19OD2882]